MSDYVTEEVFLNLDLVKEEVKIEEDQHINVVVKKESTESYKSFPLYPTETPFNRDVNGQFSCEVCGKKFEHRSGIKAHMVKHSEERHHKCSDCDYAAKRKGDLLKHININHPAETPFHCDANGIFCCAMCAMKFEQHSEIKDHMAKHREERPYKCSDCDYAAKSKENLTVHVKKLHPTETPFRCEMCSKRFSTLWLLKRHSVSHNEEKPFRCEQCSTSYKTKQSLHNHKVMVHENNGGFSCEVCASKFPYQSKLNEHMVKHNEERKHKCNDCDYAAKSKGDLTQHTRALHPTETPFQCEVCWKSFSTPFLLKKHSASHNEQKLFQCDQCSTTYKNKDGLRNHKAIVHENEGGFRCGVCGNKYLYQSKLDEHMVKHNEERKHKCSDCDYSAKSKGDLTVHIRKRHPTETPYQCQMCSKSFAILSLLKKHSVTHNEEKLFKCDQCSSTYKQKKNLRNHKFVVHDKKGGFRCELCGSTFLYRSKLKEHTDRHRIERDLKCGECGTAFENELTLNNHFIVHHTETLFQCKVCLKSFATISLLQRHFSDHDEIKQWSSIERIEEFEEIELKLEPTVIYDPEEKRDISNVKQEPEVEVKREPEYMEGV